MRKLFFAIIIMATTLSSFAQHCSQDSTRIVPSTAGGTPGLNPTDDQLPCMVRGTQVEDTLYFNCYSNFSGFAVQSLKIDSIGNLPTGLCWVSNHANNTFAGGEVGVIYIHGVTSAAPGQYKLKILIDAHVATIGEVGPDADAETLAGLRYYLRVSCPGTSCPAIDTVNGMTQAFIAYSTCAQTTATIIAGGPTTICPGGSVQLGCTVTPGGAYQYQWYKNGNLISGATAQGYSATAAGNYYAVATDSLNNHYTSNTIAVTVTQLTASITSGGSNIFCQGNIATLTANGGNSYLWNTGAVTPSITVSTAGAYTVTVSDVNCGTTATVSDTIVFNPLPTPAITATGSTSVCIGNSVPLQVTTAAHYSWNTGATTQSISASATATYIVTVTDAQGCSATTSIAVSVSNGPAAPAICIVSVDSTTNKNVIVWEKSGTSNIDSFKIYSETAIAGIYQLIRQQPFANFSTYTDVASNPTQQSSTYVITGVNQCGESVYSSPHQTIHLTSNLGVGGVVNLLWNAYIGFSYPSFNIYRGTSQGNMQLISTIASNNFSYTDLTPPAGAIYYQIEVVNPNGCVPTRTNNYNSSLSNIINSTQTGIAELTASGIKAYYSNNSGTGAINFSEEMKIPSEVRLYDLSGRLVLSLNNWQGNLIPLDAAITNGVYIINIRNANGALSAKLPIMK